MLKRPPARDIIRDIFPTDSNNWSESLPFWEHHIKAIQEGKAFVLGENTPGMALWLALRGFDVFIPFDPRKVSIFKLHQVEDSIFHLAPESGESDFDIVCLIVNQSNERRFQEDLQSAQSRLREGGILILGVIGRQFKVESLIDPYDDESNRLKILQTLGYGTFPTNSRVQSFRQLAHVANKLFQTIMPSSIKYLNFIVAKK